MQQFAKTEMTITSARYGDKLMHWLTFMQSLLPSLLHDVVAVRQRVQCFGAVAQRSSRMRSIRLNGSAAPHNNWSPIVKAPR